ncbi:MAG: PEGA domain-containing protein [Sandaracinaceae bacterium]|nr:PEGA domain-containing protein [Sandaracinaceae bacterium]
MRRLSFASRASIVSGLVGSAALLVWPLSVAYAQRASGDPRGAARERVRRAVERFEAALDARDPAQRRRELEAALAELEEANRLESQALLEWNLARVEQELGHPVSALEHAERFLASEAISAARRAEAEAMVASLHARVASVWIESPVAGASVVIDGEPRGQTPLAAPLRVPAGEVSVELRAPGYAAAQRTLRLAGETETHIAIPLELDAASSGELRVRSAQLDVRVTIDGVEVGTTPLSSSVALAPGEHRLVAERPGYLTARRAVQIVGGTDQSLELTLEPDPDAPLSTLRLEIPRVPGVLTIDGQAARGGVQRVPEGRHRLGLDLEEREPWEGEVSLVAGAEHVEAPLLRWQDAAFVSRHDGAEAQRLAGVVTMIAGGVLAVAGLSTIAYGAAAAAPAHDRAAADFAACRADPSCPVTRLNELDNLARDTAGVADVDYGVGAALLGGAAIAIPIGAWIFADSPSDEAIRRAASASVRLGPWTSRGGL